MARYSNRAAVTQALNTEYLDSIACDSPMCSMQSSGGRLIGVSKQLTGNGASVENLFVITSYVKLIELYGAVTSVGDSTTLSGFHFEISDGTTTVDLTLNTFDMSGCTVDTAFFKTDVSSVELAKEVGGQANYTEPATDKKTFAEGVLGSKLGTTTNLRIAYTGDVNTDVTITFYIRYALLGTVGEVSEV